MTRSSRAKLSKDFPPEFADDFRLVLQHLMRTHPEQWPEAERKALVDEAITVTNADPLGAIDCYGAMAAEFRALQPAPGGRLARALKLLNGSPIVIVSDAGDPAMVGVMIVGKVYGELELPAERYEAFVDEMIGSRFSETKGEEQAT